MRTGGTLRLPNSISPRAATDFVFDALTTLIATSAVATTFLVLWFGMPLRRLAELRREGMRG